MPRPTAPVPDRRVLPLVCAVVLLDVCFYAAITPLLPSYVHDLGLSTSGAGALTGAYALGTLVAGLPAGLLAARWGARPTLLLGLGVLAVASLAFGLATSFPLLAGARVLQGLSGAASWAAGLTWLVEVAPRERRGQLIGTAMGAAVVGAVGGPLLGSLAHVASPAAVFSGVAVSAVGLAGAVLATPASGQPSPPGPLRDALRDRGVLAGAWLTALPALGFGVVAVLVPLRLDALGAGAAAVAAVFLAAAAGEAAAAPLVGRLSDRRGRRVPLHAGLVLLAAVGLLLPLPRGPWLLGALVVAAAVAEGALVTPAGALLSDRAEHVGLAQGLVFGVSNLAWAGGQLLGSAGGARLADATGNTLPYLVVAALGVATLVALPRRGRVGRGGRRTAAGPPGGPGMAGRPAGL